MKTLNISYIILKLFIGRANEFAFDVRFVRICYLVSVYLENVDVSYVCPTRNSNLTKRSYPDTSNGKTNISSDSC